MAKLRMKKIELIAMLTDSKKIIELLQRRGVVEICRDNDELLTKTNITAVVGEFDKFRNTALQALEILDIYAPEKLNITEMLEGRREVEKDILGETAVKLEKTMNSANEILKCQRLMTETDTAITQINVKIDMLQQWRELDIPMNFRGTATTKAFIGSVPISGTETEFEEKLGKKCHVEIISANKEQTNIFVMCRNENAEETENALRKLAFIPI